MCVLSPREEASCWVSVEQSPFVLGLTSENGELLLDECVHVTEGSKTKERHLFLFSDVIVFAKLKYVVSILVFTPKYMDSDHQKHQ